jgi:4-amino-4-deoxy-L-arabinose transferase-like glycosyltransferase
VVQQDCWLIEETKSSGLWTLVFFLCAGLLAFVRIHIPLQEPQESRYAEIPRQMFVEDSWLVPVLHGEPYLDKPPLLYWLVMGSYSLCGVHDWAARLVPCLASFLTIAVTFFWGRRVLGPRGGFLAGAIIALSVRFIYLSRMVTMDSLLCLCVVAALAAAHLAMWGDRFYCRRWFASAVACGLGVLTKGPVALALVVCPILVFSFLVPKGRRPPIWAWLTYVGLALVVAMPWYLAVTASDPAFIEYFFWKHNVERFVTPFDHQEPFWFYLPEILGGMLPWTLLLPWIVYKLFRRRELDTRATLFLVAGVWCVLFFSLAGCKRPSYVLPAMPLLALALASYVDSWLSLADKSTTHNQQSTIHAWLRCRTALAPWILCGMLAFCLLLGGMYFFLPGHARHFSMRGQVRPLASLCEDASIRLACYPRGWDSVSFYLQRGDVKVYGPDARSELLADLRRNPRTLLFVRTQPVLEELLEELPSYMQCAPQARQGTVRVVLVESDYPCNISPDSVSGSIDPGP